MSDLNTIGDVKAAIQEKTGIWPAHIERDSPMLIGDQIVTITIEQEGHKLEFAKAPKAKGKTEAKPAA